jgi:molybdate transport system substrate-binding protein
MRLLLTIVLGFEVALAASPRPTEVQPVLVFAAASLKTALDALVEPARMATGLTMRVSYAGTPALARQIEEGAPADIFISADVEWMDYVDARGLLEPGTRVTLLTNRLVLIAPKREPVSLRIAPGFDLAGALGTGRLAVADPAVVPAGKYARAALEALGAWTAVPGRLAPAENVRAALLLVSRAEAPLGVVYRTDAVADPSVAVVGLFPEDTHPPIVYPAALTARAPAEAARVLAFLGSDAAAAEFTRQGFGLARGGRLP